MNVNPKPSEQKQEKFNNNRFMSDNTHEVDNNQDHTQQNILSISEDFEKIMDSVKREINNLQMIEHQMNNFKSKLSNLKSLKTNMHNEFVTKQNSINDNKFVNNPEKLVNFKQESEQSTNEMIGNLQLGNVNIASLENLLKYDILSKKQNEIKNFEETSQRNYSSNNNGINQSNQLNGLNGLGFNLNDEKFLKKLLKGVDNNNNNNNNNMRDSDNKIQNDMIRLNQINQIQANTQSNNNNSSDQNKHEENNINSVNNNNKSENKKSNNQSLGMSLSEIEKQIAMLKNLSIKP